MGVGIYGHVKVQGMTSTHEVNIFEQVCGCDSYQLTYNLAPMWYDLNLEWYFSKGPERAKVTDQMIYDFRKALALIEKDPASFAKYDPPNGWGHHSHVIMVLKGMLKVMEEFPQAEFYFCR